MVSDIHVSKVNEAYVRIDCDRGILKELAEYFTFFVPGAQFSPQYRERIWDGNIRLLNLSTQCIYHGLVAYIGKLAEERCYTVSYDPDIHLKINYSLIEGEDFAKSLNLYSYGQKIEARDYQIEAFVKAIRNKRHLILSPTASGKSLIDYLIVRRFEKRQGLIIVPTISLVEQLCSDFKDYSTLNGWNVDQHIHRLYGGCDKNITKPVLISTWQSIYKEPPEFFERFQFVIGEECHLFKAQSLVSVMTKLTNAEHRIGLTGTLDGTKTHRLVLEGLFGQVKRVVSTKELIDRGQLADFQVKCLVLKYPKETAKELKKVKYPEEISFINACMGRNKFIRNLALSLKGNTLILFRYVETHGQIIYESIKEKAGDRKVFFVHGSTDVETRENVRHLMETETDAIAVASVGTFSTGINIRNINNIISASPSKSRIRTLQSIGRSLRTSPTKSEATMFDIVDDLRVNNHENFAIKHFLDRVNMYKDEKFPFKIYHIDLKP